MLFVIRRLPFPHLYFHSFFFLHMGSPSTRTYYVGQVKCHATQLRSSGLSRRVEMKIFVKGGELAKKGI